MNCTDANTLFVECIDKDFKSYSIRPCNLTYKQVVRPYLYGFPPIDLQKSIFNSCDVDEDEQFMSLHELLIYFSILFGRQVDFQIECKYGKSTDDVVYQRIYDIHRNFEELEIYSIG